MKIGILTQPLHSNYGGLLQAWALQKILTEMGHNVIIINRDSKTEDTLTPIEKLILHTKKIILKSIGRASERRNLVNPTKSQIEFSEQKVTAFKDSRYDEISPTLYCNKEFNEYIKNQNFDAYVVGSDQVWRPYFSPHLSTYYLQFARKDKNIKRIAYAASFGVDYWELSKYRTKKYAKLAKLFDIITVREDSAVKLIQQNFDCDAYHVLDPTMLINRHEYENLVNNPTCPIQQSNNELFCYILDKNELIGEVVNNCRNSTGLEPFHCNAERSIWNLQNSNQINECIVPPVEQWLKSFIDSKMVITDSFHGTVFSIIFNRPFWVVSNIGRGAARMESLLKMFGLENRLIINSSEKNWDAAINWEFVNEKREYLISYSLSLITPHLR